jgi:hypothetical protein
MLTKRQSTELKHYFEIKRELNEAFRAGNAEDVEFHINELYAMHTHTESDRLRAACSATIREHRRPLMPMIA